MLQTLIGPVTGLLDKFIEDNGITKRQALAIFKRLNKSILIF